MYEICDDPYMMLSLEKSILNDIKKRKYLKYEKLYS